MERKMEMKDVTVIDSIGKGASSTVFKIKLANQDEILALKRIRYDHAEEQMKLVLNEIYCMNNLNHDNLLKLYSAFYDEGCVNIVMPYICGLSMQEALKVCPKIPDDILGRISYYIVQGLCYLRKSGFIHRDLKPSNVLLSLTGEIKIVDFGMARQLKSSEQAQTYLGTMIYMAPERLTNKPYSFKSDVWSLGLLIYECALGQFPISTEQSQICFWDVNDFVKDDVSVSLGVELNPLLKDFLSKCLVHDQNHRASINELASHPWIAKYSACEYDKLLKKWIGETYQAFITSKYKQTFDVEELLKV